MKAQLNIFGGEDPPPRNEELDQLWTDPNVAAWFLWWSNLADVRTVLEPSVGTGALLLSIPTTIQIVAFEIDEYRARQTERENWYRVRSEDFLLAEPGRVDLAIMNPPYRFVQEFVERAFLWSDRVCGILKHHFENGGIDRRSFWKKYQISRKAHLVPRPPFGDAKNLYSDFCFFELEKRKKRSTRFAPCTTEISWISWRDRPPPVLP